MGKYGKPNQVVLDPLKYNICLLGESKVGKTTLVYNMLEKLVGSEGYIFLECGHEKGAAAIQGIIAEDVPEWENFEDICDDIIDNKSTDYPDLKVIVIDTYDQLITMAESEAIRLWNNENPDKRTTSLKATWGGFAEPAKKVCSLMFDKFAELDAVGVKTFIIGHVKTKDVTDVVSGETYQTLTSDQQNSYFSALKKNLHFLGLAYIDRTIVTEKTGKKNVVTKKEETVNKVKNETRKIKFRDDSFCVDSGCRFADIVDEIPFEVDAFINAMVDAIKAEQAKSGKSFEETKAQQDKEEIENLKAIAEKAEKNKSEKELKSAVDTIITFIKDNKSNLDLVKPIMAKSKELGYAKPTDIDNIDDVNAVLKLIP